MDRDLGSGGRVRRFGPRDAAAATVAACACPPHPRSATRPPRALALFRSETSLSKPLADEGACRVRGDGGGGRACGRSDPRRRRCVGVHMAPRRRFRARFCVNRIKGASLQAAFPLREARGRIPASPPAAARRRHSVSACMPRFWALAAPCVFHYSINRKCAALRRCAARHPRSPLKKQQFSASNAELGRRPPAGPVLKAALPAPATHINQLLGAARGSSPRARIALAGQSSFQPRRSQQRRPCGRDMRP
jgi:hypothetical protein